MALSHSPSIITQNLVLCLDAGNTKSVPKTNILTTWVDYGGNQTNYEVLGAYSVKLKNTTTGWVGYFPATVSSTGKYVITFTYYSDSDGSSLMLDNDGIMDNTYNTTLTVNITPQTYTGSVDVNTTGNIQHFFRRNGGGNIYVTNVSYFKLETTWTDLSGNGNTGTLVNGVGYSASNGGSLVFDGGDDRVSTNYKPSGARSYFIWVKFSSLTHSSGYQLTGTQESNAYTYIGIQNGGDVYYYAGAATGGNIGNPVTVNTWVNLGFALFPDGSRRVYKNGVEIHYNTGGLGGTATLEFSVGCINTNYFITGNIAQVSIYNKALSAAEVSQNYNALKGRFSI